MFEMESANNIEALISRIWPLTLVALVEGGHSGLLLPLVKRLPHLGDFLKEGNGPGQGEKEREKVT